jgi:hypothetical protein
MSEHRALRALDAKRGFKRCLAVDGDSRYAADGRGAGLWYLARQILDYDKLTEAFHRPMLRAWDEVDACRARGEQIDTLDLWPRDHFKTWCERARVIRRFMRDPSCTQMWWHAVEEMAQESGGVVGVHFQRNEKLREVCSAGGMALPPPNSKRFVVAGGFSLPANRVGDAPSLRCAGAGSEVTGGHSDFGILDDPIGLNDLLDNQMPKKRLWYQATVRNVVRSHGSLDVIGTPWDVTDLYTPWRVSKHWRARVRACLETNGKRDYAGTPVLLTSDQVARKREELGETMFALQMMCDDSPPSDLPWQAAREALRLPWEEKGEALGASGKGVVFVLSDPAPAVIGSPRSTRRDGAKDEWATATIKLRNFNGLHVAILLELCSSKEWTNDDGLDECCRQMTRWATNKLIIEFSNFDWTPEMRKAARRNGVSLYLDEKGRLPRYESSYAHDAKNQRFGTLASWAQTGRFYVCDTVEPAMRNRFFEQVEHWRPLGASRNTLPHDDLGDVVSRITDPLFAKWSPPLLAREPQPLWTPFRRVEPDTPQFGARHVRW